MGRVEEAEEAARLTALALGEATLMMGLAAKATEAVVKILTSTWSRMASVSPIQRGRRRGAQGSGAVRVVLVMIAVQGGAGLGVGVEAEGTVDGLGVKSCRRASGRARRGVYPSSRSSKSPRHMGPKR